MAKTSNIKIRGTFKVGNSLVDNTLPIYKPTGDSVTLRQLLDRPDYYLGKVAKFFGINHDSRLLRKEDFWVPSKGNKSVVNPNDGDSAVDINKLIEYDQDPMMSVEVISYGDQDVINSSEYQLQYSDPIHGTKTSRNLKYYMTCEEIQHVLDNDFISGVSGFNVSSAGYIKFPTFGPYLIQNNDTGVFNQTLSVINQNNPSVISGYVDNVYDGNDDDRAFKYLKFHKTGQLENQIYRVTVSGFPESFINGTSNQTYTIGSNSISKSAAAGRILNDGTAMPYTYLDYFTISGASDLDENNNYIVDITGDYSTGAIGVTNRFILLKNYDDFSVIFDDNVDGEDMDKPLHIIGVESERITDQVTNFAGIPTLIGLKDFNSNSDYTENKYWYVGAPYVFHAHPYFNYKTVTIKNSPEIEAFRIPGQNCDATRFLHSIECTNNPNLEYFNIPKGFQFSYLNLSGCNIKNWNEAHSFHPNQEASGDYPNNMYSYYDPERHSMIGYDGKSKDLDGTEQLSPLAFGGFGLNYINLYGNNLNQTGIHYMLATLQTAAEDGYLDIRAQTPRNGPQAAIFNGFRDNPYDDIRDQNNFIVSGIMYLMDHGWTVKYDGSIPDYPSH